MKFLELKQRMPGNIFTLLDVVKYFPHDKHRSIKTQLTRLVQKGLLNRIKRGLYCFDNKKIDEFELADRLYRPSYISLETALNFYGIIPDIPQTVTSVALTTTKKIRSQSGVFSYTKIKPQLFFGFVKVQSPDSESFFSLAKKEKALLDYFYLRKIKNIRDLRLNLENSNKSLYRQYARSYPRWVRKIQLYE